MEFKCSVVSQSEKEWAFQLIPGGHGQGQTACPVLPPLSASCPGGDSCRECFAHFSPARTFQFFAFQFKPCLLYAFPKTPALMCIFCTLSLFCSVLLRDSQGHYWSSVIIIWVNYQSATSQRFVLCRFLAEPAFIVMRLRWCTSKKTFYLP